MVPDPDFDSHSCVGQAHRWHPNPNIDPDPNLVGFSLEFGSHLVSLSLLWGRQVEKLNR